MSEANVELIRRQIGQGDLAAVLRDDAAWADLLSEITPFFSPDFEFLVRGHGAVLARGSGFAEYRSRFLDWIEPWETYRPRIEKIIDLGDRVVVLGMDSGRMKTMDQEIQGAKGLVLYTFAAGKVIRIEYFFEREEGLAAAGLKP